jgi:CBS domain-containing protein
MPNRPIRDIIRRAKLVTAHESASVAAAARLMADANVGALLVVEKDHLKGIFTERDVLTRVVAKGLDPATTPLSRVMTANPDTISPDKPFGQALIMMYDHGYRHMPVVDGGKPIGIVSMRDAAPPELKDLEVDVEQREHISEILR